MQASRKHSFFRRSPAAYVAAPLLFVLVSAALLFAVGRTVLGPYASLLSWFFTTSEAAQPQDLLADAATVINGGATIIATLVAALLYGERLTVRSVAGVLLGILSMIVIKRFGG